MSNHIASAGVYCVLYQIGGRQLALNERLPHWSYTKCSVPVILREQTQNKTGKWMSHNNGGAEK